MRGGISGYGEFSGVECEAVPALDKKPFALLLHSLTAWQSLPSLGEYPNPCYGSEIGEWFRFRFSFRFRLGATEATEETDREK